MWRFVGGAVSALLLAGAGLFIWRAEADKPSPIPPAPAAAQAPYAAAGLVPPPQADERTREEKRFSRYDKDRNGAVARDEYLLSRRKAFARLDVNQDGRIDFAEYAVKASAKFAAADRDRNGALNATEFAATRVVRKSRPKPNCPPAAKPQAPDEEES